MEILLNLSTSNASPHRLRLVPQSFTTYRAVLERTPERPGGAAAHSVQRKCFLVLRHAATDSPAVMKQPSST